MCWRGHPDKYRNRRGDCRVCHARRMYAVRHNEKFPLPPRYRLNIALFRKLAHGRIRKTLELAGSSFDTAMSWLHPRGYCHHGTAKRETAQAVAVALRVPFEKLWHLA